MKAFAIFRTGKHIDSNGHEKEWTEEDLDKIVQSYDPSKHEAPIVIGHPKTNAPAFGWIERLERVGNTLFAYPKQLVKEFVDMVKQGLFKKRSISLYPDGSLRHVGFLGAKPPAVKGLPDVEFNDADISNIEIDNLPEDYTETDNNDEKQEEIERLRENIKQIESIKDEEISKLREELGKVLMEKERLLKKLNEVEKALYQIDFNEYLNKKVSEGRLLPKQVELFQKLFMDNIILNYSENSVQSFGELVNTNKIELLKKIIDSMPVIIEFDEKKPQLQISTSTNQLVAEEIRRQMAEG